MADFTQEAENYCRNRVEWLAIKRAMAATPCEYEGDPDSMPCWLAIREHEHRFSEADFCAACEGNTHNRERRLELGTRMPNLMKRMLRAYREMEK